MEEMLHMTLACNLLIAIGGSPKLANANFIPPYPSDLPGTRNTGLQGADPFFLARVGGKGFMKIEEPLHPFQVPYRCEAWCLADGGAADDRAILPRVAGAV